jgi:mono/diheme cytochrome c family protein
MMRASTFLLLSFLAALAEQTLSAAATQSTQASAVNASLSRGEYLARAGDCVACHTAPGGREYTGGRAFKLSMGTLYSPNITPDRETGIGSWSDDDFVKAMQKGVAPDGSHYYPAFPYNYFTRLSREDILAIKGYLFTLRPIQSTEPENTLSFPYSQRWLMVFWNALYNPDERFKPDARQSAQWNRGAYLAEGLGHCGACHTPMNLLQGPKSGHALGGETLQGWHAYNITSDREYGIGGWSNKQLASYLSTGHAEGRGSASGPMAEAISYSLSYLTPEDVQSIVTYLKTVKPVQDSSVPAADVRTANKAAAQQEALLKEIAAPEGVGARLFAGACAGCHAWDGSGVQTPYAALAGSRSLVDPKATNMTQVIFEGTRVTTANGEIFMPAFGAGYSDAEIAALVSFTSRHFGQPVKISPKDIRERRDEQ